MNRPRSVRWTLTLWYMGILAMILCFFSVVLYTVVAESLSRDVDKALALRADGTAGTLFAFWEAEKATRGNWKDSPSLTVQGIVERGELPDLLKRWAYKTGHLETEDPIRIIGRNGKAFIASAGFGEVGLPLARNRIDPLRHGHTLYETTRINDQKVRIVTYPVMEADRPLFFIQVASPLARRDASLRRLFLWLLFLVPFTTAVTSVVGWFLAGTALRPVAQMIAQAQGVSAEALDKRIEVPNTGDELEQLAKTFNSMLARLERAFRRLRQFSAAASHELRTPLTILKGELEVALRKPRDPAEYQRVLSTNLETVDDLSKTVEELLALARSEVVNGALEWHPVELNALIKRAVDAWGPVANEKGISLEAPLQKPVWTQGEKRLLERLVSNLLDNAIRHTPSGGKVVLRADHWRNKACLVVQDTGPGIAPDELPQLFDRFFKPSSSQKVATSSGLGLGLCHWIAEAHRGRIEVASPPGQGAHFTVWLPLSSPPSSR